MSSALPEGWPKISVPEAHRLLTQPGSPFEMEERVIRGRTIRTWKVAPPSLRAIFEAARAHGQRDFLVYEGERLTYENHHRAAVALAHALVKDFGVKKGDRVVIAMRNLPEWVIAFWATVTIGAIVVPLNAWGTGEELEYGFNDSGAVIGFLDGERAARLAPLTAKIAAKAFIVARLEGKPLPAGMKRFEDLIGAPSGYVALPDRPLPPVEIDPEDLCTIFYTSGTTGKPKGAYGTHRNVITNLISAGFAAARAFLRRGEPIPAVDPAAPRRGMLISVPFFHVTGCHSVLVPTFAGGHKLVMMYRWEPEEAMKLIEREKLNSFGGVPAIAWQVLEHPNRHKYDLSSVESVSYGGAPAAAELPQRIKEAFPKVQPGQGYGMTETSAITANGSGEEYIAHPDSTGIAVPVCDVKICDPEGRTLPPGSTGELWVYGPNIVVGYWNKPEETAKTFRDGWVVTGDIARIDEEGYIYILDRAKDMLIRGGENIYCVEVENVLYDHPRVMDAAVVGIPHPVLGEEVGAIVQVTPGPAVSEGDLQAHVAARLAKFKVPIRIDIRTEPLPRNANGKILKRQLRQEIVAARPKAGAA